MNEIKVEATIENIPKVTEFVDSILEECECPVKVQMQIDVAIDELMSNIAYYAYSQGTGEVVVRAEVSDAPKTVALTFIDSGIQYDPLKKKDPDVSLPVEEREIGGLGIFIVKKTMDDVSYEYRDGQNILTIRKILQ